MYIECAAARPVPGIVNLGAECDMGRMSFDLSSGGRTGCFTAATSTRKRPPPSSASSRPAACAGSTRGSTSTRFCASCPIGPGSAIWSWHRSAGRPPARGSPPTSSPRLSASSPCRPLRRSELSPGEHSDYARPSRMGTVQRLRSRSASARLPWTRRARKRSSKSRCSRTGSSISPSTGPRFPCGSAPAAPSRSLRSTAHRPGPRRGAVPGDARELRGIRCGGCMVI